MDTQETHLFRPVPGLDRSSEEEQLAGIIGIAQENLEKAEQYGAQLSDELHELMETYGTKDKEALAMFHNTQSQLDRKSTRLNSSHVSISYAVFCLKKKTY